jgi:hypothetical protein
VNTPSRALEGVPIVTEISCEWKGDRWLTLPALSALCGISVFVLRQHLSDLRRPLPHFRMKEPHAVVTRSGKRTASSGRILVKWSEFEKWMEGYRYIPPTTTATSALDVDALVSSVLTDFAPLTRREPAPPR